MPQKRRVLSCANCRRLKTRCTIVPGASACERCHNLKLQCTLPEGHDSAASIDIANNDQAVLQKLAAVETSLNDIKYLLQRPNGATSQNARSRRPATSLSEAPTHEPDDEQILETSPNVVQIVPVTTVRDFAAYIDGPFMIETADLMSDIQPLQDTLRPYEEELVERFFQLAKRYRFTNMTDLAASKDDYPLFYYTCLLLAIQGHSVFRGSDFHTYFHAVMKEHLGKAVLTTPSNMRIVQTLLIFTMWSLESDRLRYTDSWLLSGLTIQHWVLASSRSSAGSDISQPPPQDEHIARMMIIAQTENLKFAIGTGQSAVIDHQRVAVSIDQGYLRFSIDSDVGLVAELQLFLILYRAIIRKEFDDRAAWDQINDWAQRRKADSDTVLDFAHSSAALVLSRWESAKLNQLEPSNADNTPRHARSLELEGMIVTHSKNILSRMIEIGRATSYVKTAHDRLSGSYAAITLVEYASCIDDLAEVYALMQLAAKEQELYGFREPILNWTTDMMKKKVMERAGFDSSLGAGMQPVESQGTWIPSDLINSSMFDADFELFSMAHTVDSMDNL